MKKLILFLLALSACRDPEYVPRFEVDSSISRTESCSHGHGTRFQHPEADRAVHVVRSGDTFRIETCED